jgi:hypothetical protein
MLSKSTTRNSSRSWRFISWENPENKICRKLMHSHIKTKIIFNCFAIFEIHLKENWGLLIHLSGTFMLGLIVS